MSTCFAEHPAVKKEFNRDNRNRDNRDNRQLSNRLKRFLRMSPEWCEDVVQCVAPLLKARKCRTREPISRENHTYFRLLG